MSFKPGDMVIIIQADRVSYPAGAKPGTVATIRAKCGRCSARCNDPDIANRWRISTPTLPNACAPAFVLRKIDGELRQVVRWDSVPWQPARVDASA